MVHHVFFSATTSFSLCVISCVYTQVSFPQFWMDRRAGPPSRPLMRCGLPWWLRNNSARTFWLTNHSAHKSPGLSGHLRGAQCDSVRGRGLITIKAYTKMAPTMIGLCVLSKNRCLPYLHRRGDNSNSPSSSRTTTTGLRSAVSGAGAGYDEKIQTPATVEAQRTRAQACRASQRMFYKRRRYDSQGTIGSCISPESTASKKSAVQMQSASARLTHSELRSSTSAPSIIADGDNSQEVCLF